MLFLFEQELRAGERFFQGGADILAANAVEQTGAFHGEERL